MLSDQGNDQGFRHNHDYTALQHPRYYGWATAVDSGLGRTSHNAMIGDEVRAAPDGDPLGTVVAIYLDGMVELSTGDQVPAADLVLLRRAER